MDENKEALNAEVEIATTNQESPTEETNNSEQVAKTESTEEGQETEAEAPKKGANQRIRELANQVREEKEQKESLAQQLAALNESGYNPTPYMPQIEPGSEITQEQYSNDVARTADAIVQLRLKQQENINRINQEAVEMTNLFPQLNPNNKSEFDPELTQTVSEAAAAILRANPTASLKKVVSGLMKPYLKAVTKEVGQQTETIAKQVTQAAIRPTSVKEDTTTFADLPIEEMEKRLGKVFA